MLGLLRETFDTHCGIRRIGRLHAIDLRFATEISAFLHQRHHKNLDVIKCQWHLLALARQDVTSASCSFLHELIPFESVVEQ